MNCGTDECRSPGGALVALPGSSLGSPLLSICTVEIDVAADMGRPFVPLMVKAQRKKYAAGLQAALG